MGDLGYTLYGTFYYFMFLEAPVICIECKGVEPQLDGQAILLLILPYYQSKKIKISCVQSLDNLKLKTEQLSEVKFFALIVKVGGKEWFPYHVESPAPLRFF